MAGRQNSRSSFASIIRTLGYRNYQLFFFGQGISLLGTWAQRMALAWLIYRLTNSKAALGYVTFFSQILTPLFAPVAGVLADRHNKKKLLVITQAVSMIQALALAAVTLLNPVPAGHYLSITSPLVVGIIALSAILGLINAFDVPIRQSFQIEMVENVEDLPNAIALNSFLFNGARLIGPMVAGLLLAWMSEGYLFLVNGLSFIAVLWALIAIRTTPRERPANHTHPLQTLKEGFDYAYGTMPIRLVLIQLALASLLGMGAATLMPVFARDILHGGPKLFGVLNSSSAIGSLSGVLFLLSRPAGSDLTRFIGIGGVLVGGFGIAFGASHSLPASLICIVLIGFGSMLQMISCNTFLQTICDDDKRGRVMSLYTVAIMGMSAVGGWLAGRLGEHLGAPHAVMLLGLGCALAALYYISRLGRLRREIEPILLNQREMAKAMQETNAEEQARGEA